MQVEKVSLPGLMFQIPAEVQAAIKAAVAKWSNIDVIVNDAAMMTFKPILIYLDADAA